MTQLTENQAALRAHISEDHAHLKGHIEGTWDAYLDREMELMAQCNIATVDEYNRSTIAGYISDISKDIQGFRSRVNWRESTLAELEAEYNNWLDRARRHEELEREQAKREEEAHKERKRLNAYKPNLVFADLKAMLEKGV